MTIGMRVPSLCSRSLLLIAAVSAVVVCNEYVCPSEVNEDKFGTVNSQVLNPCNGTVQCPAKEQYITLNIDHWAPSEATNCRVVLTATTAVLFIFLDVANLTSSAACLPWAAVSQPTNLSVGALFGHCSKSRYQGKQVFFPRAAVLTFLRKPNDYESSDFAYSQNVVRLLCADVIILSSSSHVVPPLDFVGGGNCTSRLESPPGTVMKLSLIESYPRVDDSGLSNGCVHYMTEGVAAAGGECVVGKVADVGNVVTLTVQGDSFGLLCTAVIHVAVSVQQQSTSVGNASRLFPYQLLLLSAVLPSLALT